MARVRRKVQARVSSRSIQLRVNDWKIGDYDTITREGEIIVGQLCQIDTEDSMGTFRGFVLNDMEGRKREGQEREWKHYLHTAKPSRVSDTYIRRYENHLRDEINK